MKKYPPSDSLVAIIGTSCRFPGGIRSLDDYWKVLTSGKDVITEIPADRWSHERFHHPLRSAPGRSCTFAAGVVEDAGCFDHEFFDLPHTEAKNMDPQQRMALELAWEVFEDANKRPSSFDNSNTSVHIGVSSMDASISQSDDPWGAGPFTMIGNALSIIANRISYHFNLHGPSMALDTACSSSIVALHEACNFAKQDDADYAIAGGVNILASPFSFVGFSKAHMLSENGLCKVFDHRGDGYVRAEGGSLVLLKRLDKALRDGDNIHAVIRSSGVNSDGRTDALPFPSQQAQMALLKKLYDDQGIHADDIDYFEAHGTGTIAGDPVECASVGTVLGVPRTNGVPLPIGSAKSVIGHLEPVSGFAGLLKAILVMREKAVPPNLHYERPPEGIDPKELNLDIVTELTPLPDSDGPMLVGVNSFGFGGTNAHVLLHDAPQAPLAESEIPEINFEEAPTPPLLFSAKSKESLVQLAQSHADRIGSLSDSEYYNYATCAATGRDHLSLRAIVTGDSPKQIAEKLRSFATGKDSLDGVVTGECPKGEGKTAFVFSGNGSQWPGMGCGMLKTNKTFAKTIAQIDSILSDMLGWSLAERMQSGVTEEQLRLTEVSQPLLFAIQVGLIESLREKDLEPDYVYGHSVGEIAAAYASSALTLEQACHLIFHRSRLQGRSQFHGKMAAVRLSHEQALELQQVRDGRLELGAINSSSYVTLSGHEDALLEVKEDLDRKRVIFQMLDLDYPFHSKHMDPFKDELHEALETLTPGPCKASFISALAGEIVDGERLNNTYWWRNLREPVDFHAATQTALEQGVKVFLEIGPHNILSHYVNDTAKPLGADIRSIPTLKKSKNGDHEFEHAWQNVYAQGGQLCIETLFPHPATHCDLPTYPWVRGDVDRENTAKSLKLIHQDAKNPLLGFRKDCDLQAWDNALDAVRFPFLKDHVIFGDTILPGAAYLEMALAASIDIHDRQEHELVQVGFIYPMHLAQSPATDMRLVVAPDDGAFRFESRKLMSEDPWVANAVGRIAQKTYPHTCEPMKEVKNPEAFGEAVDMKQVYDNAFAMGIEFGPMFRPVKRAWVNDSKVLVEVALDENAEHDKMLFHPCLIDSAFHAMLAKSHIANDGQIDAVYIPVWVERMRFFKQGRVKYALAVVDKQKEKSIVASFDLLNKDGEVLVKIEQCRFNKVQHQKHSLNPKQRTFNVKAVPRKHPLSFLPVLYPSSSSLVDTMEPIIETLTKQHHRIAYHEEVRPLCRVAILSHCYSYLTSYIEPGTPFTLDELCASVKTSKQMTPYMAYMLQTLNSAGLATEEDGVWCLEASSDLPPAVDVWKTIVADYPDFLAESVILGRLGLHYSALLQGKATFDEIISQGSGGGIDTFNSHSPTSRFHYTILLNAIRELFKTLNIGRQLRIMEIGAGTGDLIDNILPGLPVDSYEYIATDNHDELIEQLKVTFSDYKSVSVEHLDLDQAEAIESGGPLKSHAGKVDLLLVSHSLHKVKDVRASLERCNQLLSPGGLLMFVERRPSILIDLLLGVKPQWWDFSKTPDTPQSRLMHKEQWKDLLLDVGFSDVNWLVENAVDESDSYIMLGIKNHDPLPFTEKEPQSDALWVLLEDATPTPAALALGNDIAQRLAEKGLTVERVKGAEGSSQGESEELSVDPFTPESWNALMTTLSKRSKQLQLVHLLGYDTAQEISVDEFSSLQKMRSISAAILCKSWSSDQVGVQLWLLCGGAIELPGDISRITSSQGALWGMGRVIFNEYPGLNARLIDLHCETPGEPMLNNLLLEMTQPTDEPEIALYGEQRFCTRFFPMDRVQLDDLDNALQDTRIRLQFDTPGHLDRLYWTQMPSRLPAAGEVLVHTKAVGLNFRDVMYSMGLLPEESLEDGLAGLSIGLECSGEIIAVGENVTDHQVGDAVLCLTGGCFDSHVIAEAGHVFPMPENLSFEEAATVTVAFITAYYAMKHLADIQPGESILIHGAAGGVGLAAIQVANYLGATVYATAGSDEKRDMLRLMGVPHVMDSRSLDFVDDVKRLTDDEGVDVVLNSLAGEALFKSLDLLKPMGRFLELGKRDFYGNPPLRMRPLRQNLAFFGIDVDQLMIHRQELGTRLFNEVVQLFREGKFKPLVHTVYSHTMAADAFKDMKASKHIGKLVVAFDENRFGVRKCASTPTRGQQDPNATYLVSGGVEGLGFQTARHLCVNGCKHIILLSRSGAESEARQTNVAELTSMGVDVKIVSVDVGDSKLLKPMLLETLKEMPPLKGIVHSAVVLDDGIINNLTPERISNVLHAKALGAWNLHTAVEGMELDFFIMYSSVITMLGNPGQANYAAANTAVETLASYRRSQGLPAVAIGWGPISDVGWLSRNEHILDAAKKMIGVKDLTSQQVMSFLDGMPEELGSRLYLFSIDWSKIRQLPFARTPVFNSIEELSKRMNTQKAFMDPKQIIRELPKEEAIQALAQSIGAEIGNMLKLPTSKTGPEVTIVDLGMDSLMLVELGLMIEEQYGVNVSQLSLGQSTTLGMLAERIYGALSEDSTTISDEQIAFDEMTQRHGINVSKEKVTQLLKQEQQPAE